MIVNRNPSPDSQTSNPENTQFIIHHSSFIISKVFPEVPEFSFSEIIQVVFIRVSFSFKRNSSVSQVTIFEFEEPIIVFDNIKDVKENDEHFQLLPQMDFFVIDQYIIFLIFGFPNEDKGKESNAINF
ncbi:MAG: hypothetical protein J7550_00275 [Chryseobacterium sp.]|nr:hypothetical protein [Chryseobacterium sp.]